MVTVKREQLTVNTSYPRTIADWQKHQFSKYKIVAVLNLLSIQSA